MEKGLRNDIEAAWGAAGLMVLHALFRRGGVGGRGRGQSPARAEGAGTPVVVRTALARE